MPVEVIDLLSSPELRTSIFSSKENVPRVSSPPLTKRSLTCKIPKRENDAWFSLSSDSDVEISRKSPKPAIRAPSQPSATLKSRLNAANKPVVTSYHSNAVYFNSDNFDSAISIDNSYAINLPPGKKRRLSSSPEILLPKPKAAQMSGFRRCLSNREYSSSKPETRKSSNPSMQKSNAMGMVLESDPIVFTSSPDPFADIARRKEERRTRRVDMGESDENDVFGLRTLAKKKGRKKGDGYDISDPSDIDLPDLGEIVGNDAPNGDLSVLDNYYADRVKEKKAREAVTKAEEMQAKKAAKEAEKERKRLEREEKANEKERLAELARVNVVRTSKQKSSHEMMVDIPSTMLVSDLGTQVTKLLDKAEIRHSSWESTLPVVRWSRDISSDYNEEAGQWVPVPTHIKRENHALFILSAKEFVELAIGEEGKDLDAHFLQLRAKFPSCKIIYLIEGLTAWMRKNKTIQNRKYTETVRNQGQDEPAASQRAKKKKQEEYIDEDLVEDALLRLQVKHGALIHHTAAMIETAEWILVFTQHISTIPYRLREQALNTTFCMEAGQVRSGEDAADTFTRMLQEMTQITAAVAHGIAAEHPTVRELTAALQRDGPLALQDCRKTVSKNGAFTDRRVGPSISRRLHSGWKNC
ncbi:hypothetical protein OIDMADRAFT_145433 [Oidiodendron maius Zn]|uniref:ERCC4 domain-containing protein n=1 Tax=Oidiodendron maius (strain Zn) TaxID=913774 RepID=A0A0C3HDS1_OIDMZ|nr:hypothetical protein OIDMADRAFT_145433 [Oidiodendron maius Zn]